MSSHNEVNLLIACLFFLGIVGCTQATPTSTATSVPPTEMSTAIPMQVPTFTPSPEPTSTLTPTPATLAPVDIFDLVSPAVAFVDTPTGTGSGILIADGYVLTNAHVVWPFEAVRLVFADGTEFLEAPVFNVDLMADLAVIGPLDTDIAPATLVDGEDRVIGSDVYLIGYPGEVEEFPQPTITRGLISRLREWSGVGITYFQSDAAIARGQSGGVLVGDNGDVIGISGFYFTEAGFAMVASAADIWPRVQALMAGDDISGLGEWRLPAGEGRTTSSVILDNELADSVFIIHEPAGTNIELELSGRDESEAYFLLTDIYGNSLIYGRTTSARSNSAATELDAPYFVRVYQNSPWLNVFNLKSNTAFTRFSDEDDNRSLIMGHPTNGRINYPGDLDYYVVHLEAGQAINLQVDSILIDPQVSIVLEGLPLYDYAISDDDSGGGIFGINAELTYETPETGFYTIVVESVYGNETGGYILTMDDPYPGAPTPIAPTATPRPYETDLGLMNLYTNPSYGFSFEYPGEWTEVRSNHSPNYDTCQGFTVCFESIIDGFLLGVFIDDFSFTDQSDMTTDEYVDRTSELIAESGISITSRDRMTTNDGLTLTVLTFEVGNEDFQFKAARMIYVSDGLAYNIIYFAPADLFADLEPFIEYSFESFTLE